MANILYIDDDEIAIKVISSIFKRSGDTLCISNTADEAWKMLSESVFYDIVFVEVKLQSGNASSIINRIREDPFIGQMPVVVYSRQKDKAAIKKIRGYNIQNYLLKPFREEVLKDEVDKAMQCDWRIHFDGDDEFFYKQADDEPDEFYKKNVSLFEHMEVLNPRLTSMTTTQEIQDIKEDIKEVADSAASAYYSAYSDILNEILENAKNNNWSEIQTRLFVLNHALLIQDYRVALLESYFESDDDSVEENNSGNDKNNTSKIAPKATEADSSNHESLLNEIEEKIKTITEYPIVESAGATFMMLVNDEGIRLEEISEIVEKDPGLATAVLTFSNSPVIAASNPTEDIHRAVALIGIKRIRTFASSIRTVPDSDPMFKAFKWQRFWMRQLGCAILSQYVFEELKLPGRPEIAYVAGLISDIGKIILCEIHPEKYAAAVNKSKEFGHQLSACERDFFGCDYCHAGFIFAEQNELPDVLKNVLAYQENPAKAVDSADVVACVSIASYLCQKYKIGNNGNSYLPEIDSLSSHPAWELIQRWVSPSFDTEKFLHGIEKKITSLKGELKGLMSTQ